MTSATDNLIDGLQNVYAIEGQAITLLETQIKRLESYPEMLPRLRAHLEESKQQQAAIERCLEQLGSSGSSLKAFVTKAAAGMHGMFQAATADEVIKSTLSSYAFESFEAASYRSLIAMAHVAGKPDIAAVCERHLKQELEMQAFVWEMIPQVSEKFLERSAAGAKADR